MKTKHLLVGAVLAIAIGAPIAGFLKDMKGQPMTPAWIPFLHGLPAGQGPGQAALASLERANEWLNSSPLTVADLHGKVVLVDFWTYTCINWLRTLPYVRAWAEKYRDQGLVVIGVHSPEFPFEKNPANVRAAVSAMRINYPVAVDSDHVIWRAFDNHHWPALYFIDAQGRIRHFYFGEGEYERSEMIIQMLLAEAGAEMVSREPVSIKGEGIEAAAVAQESGLKVWLDKRDLVAGSRWKESLQSALRQSTAFAVYLGSLGIVNWVWDEVSIALDRAHCSSLFTLSGRESPAPAPRAGPRRCQPRSGSTRPHDRPTRLCDAVRTTHQSEHEIVCWRWG